MIGYQAPLYGATATLLSLCSSLEKKKCSFEAAPTAGNSSLFHSAINIDQMASDKPTIVLLHGLGATGRVWDSFIDTADWSGRVIAPDLCGHGSAPWSGSYSFGTMAAEVSKLLEVDEPYVVLGHSMGGGVGAALATGFFGTTPLLLGTIGVKLAWAEAELSKLPEIAGKPPRIFDDQAGAADWFLKLSGLIGVADIDSTLVESGVMQVESGWKLCQDPRTVLVVQGSPPFAQLFSGLLAPVHMSLGENDPLVSSSDHVGMPVNKPHVFTGLGHNVMVEDPLATWAWFSNLMSLS